MGTFYIVEKNETAATSQVAKHAKGFLQGK